MFKFFQDRKYWKWSIFGTLFIVGAIYFDVQLDVAINKFFGSFYDLIQKALTKPGTVKAEDLLLEMLTFAKIAGASMVLLSLLDFFARHWIFRWRTSMNQYYIDNLDKLRHIEGSSQRIQEDAMRFSRIIEDLGTSLIRAVLTIVAFLPILWELSKKITVLPFIGAVPHGLMWAAILFALFGTVIVMLVSRKLPGLEYENQKVEAAYRKELVYGEDDKNRAAPKLLGNLFADVRKNYFKIYLQYMYFDVTKWSYLQFGAIVPYILMSPSIAAGAVTLGVVNRVGNSFRNVEKSLQYLVRSYGQIIDMLSIRKRLLEFENQLDK